MRDEHVLAVEEVHEIGPGVDAVFLGVGFKDLVD